MKRDMELIRFLLQDIEGGLPKPDLSAYSEDTQIYHLALLEEAGLIIAGIGTDEDGLLVSASPVRLTWSGHEFLDAARNESAWRKIRSHLAKAGATVTISVLQDLLMACVKEQLRLS